jgi:hypothetical protein
VPNVTTRSLCPECIANLKLPIDAFYRESRSGVNIAKRNITTGLFELGYNTVSGSPEHFSPTVFCVLNLIHFQVTFMYGYVISSSCFLIYVH